MGLRGKRAGLSSPQPWPEPRPVTPQMVSIYRRILQIERQCSCPPSRTEDSEEEPCEICAECLRLVDQLGVHFGLPPWMDVFENPAWGRHRPRKDAIERFYLLEKASKRMKHRYKWEK